MIFRDTDTSETGLTPTGESYTRLWAVQDANYNVVALLNNSGTVGERDAYDPFGAVTVMNSSYTVEDGSSYNWVYLFQGGRQDTIASDTQFGERDDNSPLGVWTTPDPTGLRPDEDHYRFLMNEPVEVTDPTGEAPIPRDPVQMNEDAIVAAYKEYQKIDNMARQLNYYTMKIDTAVSTLTEVVGLFGVAEATINTLTDPLLDRLEIMKTMLSELRFTKQDAINKLIKERFDIFRPIILTVSQQEGLDENEFNILLYHTVHSSLVTNIATQVGLVTP